MRRLPIGLAHALTAIALVAAACSGTATEPEPVLVATVDASLPTPVVVPSAPPTEGPTPTPTTRVISIPGTPSADAVACSTAGLVAAGLDACLQYEAAGCFWFSDREPCTGARERLQAVHGTRVFPSDCGQAGDDDEPLPVWCDDTDPPEGDG